MDGFKKILILLCCFPMFAFAESQSNDYKGITDPFGDPANYEFAEDEKEDKEFFHLGRYLTFGLDFGAGIFTGGLGETNDPGFYFGARLVYYFDKHLAMEAAGHFAKHLDSIPVSSTQSLDIDTSIIPITLGFRYYFDTKNAPKAVAMSNPYLALGGGIYLRDETPTTAPSGISVTGGSNSSFGANAGGGVEFAVYGQHVYLGVDIRYHLVFFSYDFSIDPSTTSQIQESSRTGGYFTAVGTLTYSF